MNISSKEELIVYCQNYLKEKSHKSLQSKVRQNKSLNKIVYDNTKTIITINFSEKLYCLLNDITKVTKCQNKNCNNKVKFLNGKYNKFCCVKCGNTLVDVEAKQYTKQEFSEYCKDYLKNKSSKSLLLHIRRNQSLLDYLNEYSTPLDKHKKVTNGERLYFIVNNLNDRIKCNHCKNKSNFWNFDHGYNKFCCKTCANQISKRMVTYLNIITKESLIDIINYSKENLNSLFNVLERNEYLYDSLKYYTSFLNNHNKVKISERVYCLLNNINDRPKCLTCDKYINFRTFSTGYSNFCNTKCSTIHESVIAKVKATSNKNWGTDYPMQNKIVFDKNRESGFSLKIYEYRSKDYIALCGGYEPFALNILEYLYDPKDIDTQVDLDVWYYDQNNIKRKYYPDIYIKEENKIIEVKCEHTYETDLDINLTKASQCIHLGYDYEFWIFDENGKLERCI